LKLASLTVIDQIRTRAIQTSMALRSRFAGIRAASDNVTQGTWIIVAVALAALIVLAVAIPGSPVHTWLSNLFGSITSISA